MLPMGNSTEQNNLQKGIEQKSEKKYISLQEVIGTVRGEVYRLAHFFYFRAKSFIV